MQTLSGNTHGKEAARRQQTVLLADDDIGVRAVLTVLLRSNGFHVLTAKDGEEALKLFNAHLHEIGVVLFDVHMPLLTGPAALEEIRRIRPDIRAVITSGMERNEILKKYPIEPPWAFLPKPFAFCDIEELFPRAA